jgi:hypothetical protein
MRTMRAPLLHSSIVFPFFSVYHIHLLLFPSSPCLPVSPSHLLPVAPSPLLPVSPSPLSSVSESSGLRCVPMLMRQTAGQLESEHAPGWVEAYAAKCFVWRVRGGHRVTGGLRMDGLEMNGMLRSSVPKIQKKRGHCIEYISRSTERWMVCRRCL